jgi:endonuclease/exonuclease/phosphatase family metal-dependent hydrolase
MSKTLRILLMVLIHACAHALAYYILTAGRVPQGEVARRGDAEVDLVTWNLYNFGRSKDADEMAYIAAKLRSFELVAIQEVSTGQAGAQALARLDDLLDRTGADWDYTVSDPTTGNGSERYAYLWQSSQVRLVGQPWLEASLAGQIDREPFLARFEVVQTGKRLLIASFHAVPTSKKPATEIAFLDRLHERYGADNLVILGDFNLPERHQAFDGLKGYGYAPVLAGQRTSLRMKRTDGEYLANEYDNIFVEAGPLRPLQAGVVDFVLDFRTLPQARSISDHLPVYVTLGWN